MLRTLALSSLACLSSAADVSFDFRHDAGQIVLVTAESADGARARIGLWEKARNGWHPAIEDIPAVIGRHGLGLGKGLHDPDFLGLGLPEKKEGDLKAPAGVFFFGDIYGYAARPPKGLKLNYIQALESFEGVDDPASRFYNRIVDTRAVGPAERDWKSHEQMRRKDELYRWLAVIRHNEANTPGGGSLIFMHIWKAPESGTAGCTAMAEADLLKILRWLDPKKRPILVQIPSSAIDDWWRTWSGAPQ